MPPRCLEGGNFVGLQADERLIVQLELGYS